MIETVIVDDEPLARRRLRQLLESEASIQLVAEYGDAREAISGLREHGADLLFVDIQMPEVDGFDVVESVGVEKLKIVVFVTAHAEHALRAFDVRAVDYLVKPFTRIRFQETLSRVKEILSPEANLASNTVDGPGTTRIPVRLDGRVRLVPVDRISWIEAARNYAIIHVDGERLRARASLKSLEDRLKPEGFLRVHRSALVNVERVRELEAWSHGDYVLTMMNGGKVIVSRSHAQTLMKHLGM